MSEILDSEKCGRNHGRAAGLPETASGRNALLLPDGRYITVRKAGAFTGPSSSEINFADVLEDALSCKDQRIGGGKTADLVSVSGKMKFLNLDISLYVTSDIDKSHGLFFGAAVGTRNSGNGDAYVAL